MPRPIPQPVRPKQFPEYKASYDLGLPAASLATPVGLGAWGLQKLANMLSPTVRSGHTFTAVDNTPRPAATAFIGDALRAVGAVDRYNHLPTKVFADATLNRSLPRITERNFSPEELTGLQKVVSRVVGSGRKAIGTRDYYNPGYLAALRAGVMPDRLPQPRDSGDWNNIVGQALVRPGPRPGTARVIDRYDFNNYEGQAHAGHKDEAAMGEAGLLMPSAIAAWYGRRALPSGLRGVPVDITVPLNPETGRK